MVNMAADNIEQKEKIKGIVRLVSTDVDGNISVERGLRKVKGISFAIARAVCMLTNIDPKKKIGMLTEGELKNIEETLKNLNLPDYLFNRRKDIETGKNIHIVGTAKLDLVKREDINLMKRIKCYKGLRHSYGLTVRGQRTRGAHRHHKTVGVMKAKQAPAKAAPKTAKPAEAKK